MAEHKHSRRALAAAVLLLVGIAGVVTARLIESEPPPSPAPVVAPPPPLSKPAVVFEATPLADAGETLTEPREFRVTGHLLEVRSWQPVQATVTLTAAGSVPQTITSGRDGAFSTRLSPGVWSVVSAEGDFAPTPEGAQLFVPASDVANAHLRLERLGWLEGTVVDEENKPVADALVNEVRTDAAGRFRVRAREDPNQLRVTHPACRPGHSWTNKRNVLVITLKRWRIPPEGVVSGVVTNDAGVPCATMVGLVERPSGGSVRFLAASDGTFTVPVFGPDTHAFAQSGEVLVQSEILRVGQPVRLVVPCHEHLQVTVSGRLVDERGAPWPDCSVQIGNLRPRWFTTTQGAFALRTEPLDAIATFWCMGTGNSEQRRLTEAGDQDLGEIVVPRGEREISGDVIDRQTRLPVAFATIALARRTRAITDATGHFTLGLRPRADALTVSAQGYLPFEAQLEADTTELVVELTPAGESDGGVRQEYEGVGMGLESRPPDGGVGLRVTVVAPGGPAEEGGVRVDDELLAVDDAPVTDFKRPRDLHERIKGPAGTWVKLSLRRDGRGFDVRLQRRRLER